MEAGDCPTLNMNAKENYLLSQSLRISATHNAKFGLEGRIQGLSKDRLKDRQDGPKGLRLSTHPPAFN